MAKCKWVHENRDVDRVGFLPINRSEVEDNWNFTDDNDNILCSVTKWKNDKPDMWCAYGKDKNYLYDSKDIKKAKHIAESSEFGDKNDAIQVEILERKLKKLTAVEIGLNKALLILDLISFDYNSKEPQTVAMCKAWSAKIRYDVNE